MTAPCPVCGDRREHAFTAQVLGRHQVAYLSCASCGLLQTEEPHWLDEAYARAIADADTGLLARNLSLLPPTVSVLAHVADRTGTFVDVAGGYGVFTRLMRDVGFDYRWHDVYADNLFAQGAAVTAGEGVVAEAVTAFEVLEHLSDPVAFITEHLERFDTHTMLFTTELFEGPPPAEDWWYYAFGTGQHVSFFQERTLARIARDLGVHFVTNGGLHLFSDRPVSRLTFRALTGRGARVRSAWIGRRMRSLPMEDHRRALAEALET